jgi:hypothetical protein
MIRDAFGVVAQVGDILAYSRGNSGTRFDTATVERITNKSVIFTGRPGSNWRRDATELRRGEGQFVIKRDTI